MSTDIEAPLYRVIAKDGALIGGAMRAFGAEVADFRGWPKPLELEAVNPSAIAIATFHAKHHASSFCPKSPWVAEFGSFYLPGALHRMDPSMSVRGVRFDGDKLRSDGPGYELLNPVPVNQMLVTMPKYRARTLKQIGRHVLEPDHLFAYLAFPHPDFEPVNEAGRKVVAYHSENYGHGSLLPSPWCQLRQALFLPELPLRSGMTTKAFPDGSFVPIDPNNAAVRSEIERVTGRPAVGR
jgi:hypothetical protein